MYASTAAITCTVYFGERYRQEMDILERFWIRVIRDSADIITHCHCRDLGMSLNMKVRGMLHGK